MNDAPAELEIWSNSKVSVEVWVWRDSGRAQLHYFDKEGEASFWPDIRVSTADALCKDMDMTVRRPGLIGRN